MRKIRYFMIAVLFMVLAIPSISLAAVSGISLVASQSYMVGSGYSAIFSGLVITGTGNMTSATINIDSNFNSVTDSLSYGPVPAGLSASYDNARGVLTVRGTALVSTYEDFLKTVMFRTHATSGTRSFVLLLSTTSSVVVYSDYTKHYYEFVSAQGITWTAAKAAAETRSYDGHQGYLATITSAAENAFVASKCAGAGWLGASDAQTEGTWQWVTGPEAGTIFWINTSSGDSQNPVTGDPVNGMYSNWVTGKEPNQAGEEDYLHILGSIKPSWARELPEYTTGKWNDFAGGYNDGNLGYVVEYGATEIKLTESKQSATVDLTIVSAPLLAADTTNNNVDFDIVITYPADSAYTSAITGVSYNGVPLTPNTDYTVTNGAITLKPSGGNSVLRTPKTAAVVVTATGFANNFVSQTINAGAISSMAVTTQPVPGAASGNTFLTQPVVSLYDQYGNLCSTGPSTSAVVQAAPKTGMSGGWTAGGATTRSAAAGMATFAGLTCTMNMPGQGAIAFTSGGKSADSNTFTLPNWPAKALMPDTVDNNVDHVLEIAFASDTTFETGVTAVTYRGETLAPGTDYTVSSGKITLTPSASGSAVLRTPGTGTLTISSPNYHDSICTLVIQAGEAVSLAVTIQPTPGAISGDAFTTQPAVALKDQYGNVCSTGASASLSVTAAPAADTPGSWVQGGTADVAAANGVATYSNLTCTQMAAGKGAIAFTSGGLSTSSDLFDIPRNPAKELTPDTTQNDVDHSLEIAFPADPSFEAAVTGVSYKGVALVSGTDYIISAGKLTLLPGGNAALKSAGSGDVIIQATGYYDSAVSQTLVPVKPTVSTQAVTGIFQNSATANGNIVSNGGVPIEESGFVYALDDNPSIGADIKVISDSGADAFRAILAGLDANTLYHVRAYACNGEGISYGEDVCFQTLPVPKNASKIKTDPPYGTLFHGMALSASITPNPGEVITLRGFVYSIADKTPSYGDRSVLMADAGAGGELLQ